MTKSSTKANYEPLKLEDVAYVRFRAPDLARMRGFLEDFGLAIVEATDRRLVARGACPAPVTHVTELGEPRFAGVAFRAASVADLERRMNGERLVTNAQVETAIEQGVEAFLRAYAP